MCDALEQLAHMQGGSLYWATKLLCPFVIRDQTC